VRAIRTEPGDRRSLRFMLILVALVLGLVAFTAAGCGGDDDEGDGGEAATGGGDGEAAAGEGSIWVLLPDSATSPRWESDDRRFFEEAFTDAGVDFNIVNAEGDAAQQQSQAEQAAADGASVIVLVSLDTGSGATIIDQAKEEDIQVVEYDRFNTGGSGGAAYVSFDNVKVGETMAEVMEPVIDDLGESPARVVMLNGGEEDNNAFLFRQGYKATVDERVKAGDWELVDDQFVPGWGANGEGQGIMEQILTDANNDVDAVFAANDNLAQQTINALDAAGVEGAPVSGQDATAAGIQNVLLGKQTVTVYKPIQDEAGVAAAVALALRAGEDPLAAATDYKSSLASGGASVSIIGIDAAKGESTDSPEGEGVVPYVALVPIGVTADNVADTVIADGFRTVEEVCKGDTAQTDFCQENQ
jgi:D-xylose transport system substrate-binding protein